LGIQGRYLGFSFLEKVGNVKIQGSYLDFFKIKKDV